MACCCPCHPLVAWSSITVHTSPLEHVHLTLKLLLVVFRKGRGKKTTKKGVRFKQKNPQQEHKEEQEEHSPRCLRCAGTQVSQEHAKADMSNIQGSEQHLNGRETLNPAPSLRLQRRQVAGGEASNHDNLSFFGTRQQR